MNMKKSLANTINKLYFTFNKLNAINLSYCLTYTVDKLKWNLINLLVTQDLNLTTNILKFV
jgi:hypothetical protein